MAKFSYRDALVAQIGGCLSASPHLRDAFLAIPRHLFVSDFYERVNGTDQLIRKRDLSEQEWMSHIYQDKPLITSLDRYGLPESSSSQPSIMAKMLDSLDVQPGQRVLEIGTGTGYNAALLAYLTGDPSCVTTIDIDEQLIEQARPAIEQVGGRGMTVMCADGREGYAPGAPYDRMIATGSVDRVPLAWVEQLIVGGQMVISLHTTLLSALVLLKKTGEHEAVGEILPYLAAFMDFHDGHGVDQSRPVPRKPITPILEQLETHSFYPDGLELRDFTFFLQCLLPRLNKYRASHERNLLVSLAEDDGSKHVQFHKRNGVVTVRGHAKQWKKLQTVAEVWGEIGKPKRTVYTFAVRDGHQTMYLEDQAFPLTRMMR